MADPFGIIGVIGVAGQIIQLTVKITLDWKDVPDDTKRFLAEIRTLKTVLSETYTDIISNDDFKSAFHGRHSTLQSQLGNTAGSTNTSVLISACNQELSSLLDDLKKQEQGHRVGWERLKGAFLATKTREAVENLQRQCRTLNDLVDIDALALAVQTHKEVTETRKQHQAWQRDRENKAVLDWITPVDYSTQQSDIFRRRQPGTGQWLLDSAEYHQWADTSQKTLFCPGIPGAGKTILTSIIVDDLHTRFRDDEHVGIAFLYCNFKRQAEQKVEDLLSSVLQQLAQDQASLPECVRSLHDKHKGKTRPTLEELSTALQIVAKQFSRIFIVVDALDECQLSDGCQSKFLTELFALQNTSGANIFASSRFIQNITDRFKGTISLEIRAHPEDVRRYLQGNMAHMPACLLRSPDLQDEIITTIVKAVDGMFLLAQLHLNSLAGKKSPKAIRRSLATLHTGSDAYDHAYGAAMERIEGQIKGHRDLAKQVLSWVTCSKRPLSTTELQHALSVEVGETELDLQNVSEIEDIISVCAGLVTIDEESNIIRLVHYTTQEYFMRTWKQRFPDAQMEITEVCATYLSFRTFDGGFCRTDTDFEEQLRSHPLYDYAGHFWGDHAREAEEASRVVTRLLKNDMHVEAHVQVLMTVKRSWDTSYSLNFIKRMRGLHIAAYFGIKAATRDLLDGSDRPDITDESGRTPLSWAAENGHDAVVNLLLDTGQVDVDSKDNDGRTPLSWAAENRHDAVVKLLLDTGQVDVDSKDKYGRTPLLWAAGRGQDAVVKLLLDTGQVNVDSKDNVGCTALQISAFNHHGDVEKLLLA